MFMQLKDASSPECMPKLFNQVLYIAAREDSHCIMEEHTKTYFDNCQVPEMMRLIQYRHFGTTT